MSIDDNKIKENFQLPPQMISYPSSYVNATQNPLAAFANVNATQNPLTAFALAQSASQLNSIKQAILRSLFELTEFQNNSGSSGSVDSSPVDSLVSKYNDLLARVSAYNPGENNTATIAIQLSEFRKELSTLDGLKTTSDGFISTVKESLFFIISHMLYVFGPIFSIILVTNTFYHLTRVPTDNFFMNLIYKFFFAFWATIWYPLVFLYGIFDPPVFRAWFPLVTDVPNSTTPSILRLYRYKPPGSPGSLEVNDSEMNKNIMRFFSALFTSFWLYVYMFYDDMV
jgi:hypothetical protein